ncbi:hypothetical protein HJ588_09565 [Flexivirga sp. ID2601S]|uniref:Uncharacterized protein n=1 Tax=Flexivirga aerilata TaxID=1656889 RepID=A0A849AIY8_9MICO|nr:hypothetical protein [Flexivirga aerilata]NNG39516.1 hypothetical protein [Flexivirga aerilata]
MTDDFDRTQEIRRDRDWEGGGERQPDQAQQPYPQQPATQPTAPPDYRAPDYRAPGSYAPGGARPSYEPGVRTDNGDSGFPAATVGAVVAAVLMAVSSFLGHQLARDGNVSMRSWNGWLAQTMPVAFWPFDGGGQTRATTAFVVALAIVLFLVLLLLMLATMSTRSGNGGFALLLSGWMSCVLAGAVARVVAGLIGRDTQFAEAIRADVMAGATWGLAAGWIVGCATVAVHLLRRKPHTF